MVMIEVFISFICLVSLIVILIEAQHFGGFRRKWPIAVWACCLAGLSLLALLRVFANRDDWSDARIFMGVFGAGNFLFGAGLLVRWLFWRRPSPGATSPPALSPKGEGENPKNLQQSPSPLGEGLG
jgi:hypothetical protein